MTKVYFQVSEDTKKKRRWVVGVLAILIILSTIMLSIGFPFNTEVSMAFLVSFSVAFILKVIEWVEGSKIMEEKK
ncbi:MAG TPA: hypothetical protein PLK34_02680 [Candidatus Pacearchaeota archaeon]|nr:hypothetical protein [Candidatus Pacearchaeota archaeon]